MRISVYPDFLSCLVSRQVQLGYGWTGAPGPLSGWTLAKTPILRTERLVLSHHLLGPDEKSLAVVIYGLRICLWSKAAGVEGEVEIWGGPQKVSGECRGETV